MPELFRAFIPNRLALPHSQRRNGSMAFLLYIKKFKNLRVAPEGDPISFASYTNDVGRRVTTTLLYMKCEKMEPRNRLELFSPDYETGMSPSTPARRFML
jgi:hypothetical protein